MFLQEELQQSKAALASQQQALQEVGLKLQDAKQAAGSSEAATEKQLHAAQLCATGLKLELQEALRSKEACERQASAAEAKSQQSEAQLQAAIFKADAAEKEVEAAKKEAKAAKEEAEATAKVCRSQHTQQERMVLPLLSGVSVTQDLHSLPDGRPSASKTEGN